MQSPTGSGRSRSTPREGVPLEESDGAPTPLLQQALVAGLRVENRQLKSQLHEERSRLRELEQWREKEWREAVAEREKERELVKTVARKDRQRLEAQRTNLVTVHCVCSQVVNSATPHQLIAVARREVLLP